jgi:hypothetical protein
VPETLSLTVTATGCTDNGAVAILEYDDVDSWVGADDKCDVLWVLTCTADVWSTGVDFVELGVLARADARDSRIMDTQIPGRANRIHESKAYALVLDCYDEYHDTLRGRSDGRKRWYVKQGWRQTGLATRRIGVRKSSKR